MFQSFFHLSRIICYKYSRYFSVWKVKMKYKAESRPLLCLINLRNTAQKLLPYGKISISSLEIYIHRIEIYIHRIEIYIHRLEKYISKLEIEILTLPVDKWAVLQETFPYERAS